MSLDIALTCRCVCGHDQSVFDRSGVTHNLIPMATEAGIYTAMWHPEKLRGDVRAAITLARELILVLTAGLADLKTRPDHFRTFNPENGWGDYDGFVEVVEEYLAACIKHPNAMVETST